MKPLAELQSWMQQFITGPTLDAETLNQADLLVLPSNRLSSEERVGVYRGMYLPRLIEALELDYPGVLELLGPQRFEEVATAYLHEKPSRSYTLNRLGDRFPESLMGFAAQLARLELAITQVFDEEECPVLTSAGVAAVPEEAWETARLRPIAAMRLLAFGYPVSEFLEAVLEKAEPVTIIRKRTYVAVYRRDYTVERLALNYQGFKLLSSLTLGVRVAEAVASSTLGRKRIFDSFRQWTAAGLFQAIQL